MKPRIFEIRGLPARLLLGVIAVMALGVLALGLMVGAAVVVAGLGISAVAALYYTLRRKLSLGTKRHIWLEPAPPPPAKTHSLKVRDIDVEVLPRREE